MLPLLPLPDNPQARRHLQRADLLAGDDYWDGRGWDRHGRNQFLLRAADGCYILHQRSRWPQEEDGRNEQISVWEARCIFANLPNRRVKLSEAFPELSRFNEKL
ncbi:MAG: hypothetical protein V1797_17355 [Pseudomonadota bacterium]